jgi:hypothetical protein
MTPDVIARAFDPFFTTKPAGHGTGLGLSMIYGFARQSGGQVRIYSEVGQGTTMCIYLPRHYGDAEGAESIPDLASAPRAEQGETVFIVDDEPSVRMLVTEVLEDQGHIKGQDFIYDAENAEVDGSQSTKSGHRRMPEVPQSRR